MRLTKTATALMSVGTAALSDAMDKSGALDHGMRCVSGKARMAGEAFTVRVHTADILMVAKALSECGKGDVLVIDGRGELNTALWGELTTLAALRKGLAGVVIDGAVRDIAAIRRSPLPVFARAVVPNAGGAEYLGELNVAVQCGGQVIRPRDWVIGDDDGVVVVPAEHMSRVQGARRNKSSQAEKLLEQEIRKGADLGRLLRIQEVIERKQSEVFIPQLRSHSAKAAPVVSQLPAWGRADLPEPLPLSFRNALRTIGPGAILLAASIGGGEWLVGPAVAVKHGIGLFWIATLAIVLQTIFNLEAIRYTLYTGEPIVAGFMRLRPSSGFWATIYTVLSVAQLGMPALGAASATVIFAAFCGPTASCSGPPLRSRRIRRCGCPGTTAPLCRGPRPQWESSASNAPADSSRTPACKTLNRTSIQPSERQSSRDA